MRSKTKLPLVVTLYESCLLSLALSTVSVLLVIYTLLTQSVGMSVGIASEPIKNAASQTLPQTY